MKKHIIFTGIAVCLAVFSSSSFSEHHKAKVGSTLHKKESVAIQDVPSEVISIIMKAKPDFKIGEAEKEFKHGNTYYDVEGVDGEGKEIEFDMLLGKDGKWRIAEIQRDLVFSQLPSPVAKLFKQRSPKSSPARIIESDQGGGVVVYEFYLKENGQERKHEIKLAVEWLEKEWKH